MASTDDHPVVMAGTRWTLGVLATVVIVAAVVGMAVLATRGDRGLDLRPDGPRISATVDSVQLGPCPGSAPDDRVTCATGTLRLHDGTTAALAQLPATSAPDIEPGDDVVVTPAPGGGYDVIGFRGRGPLLSAIAIAALIALALAGGGRGLRAVVALLAAAVVLVAFTVPTLLDGQPAMAVAAVSAAMIAAALVVLVHGVDARARVAFLGAIAGAGVALGVGQALRKGADLAGLADARPAYLHVLHGRVPTNGLLLAGIVIGATGALVELATRQVDATWDLRDTPPTFMGVLRAGLRRGRGALAGMTTTLVLAYAGAALPAVILLTAGDDGLGRTMRGETMAVEVARSLAGGLALAAVVPITAVVAALVAVREAATERDSGDPRRFRSRRERELWQQEGDT